MLKKQQTSLRSLSFTYTIRFATVRTSANTMKQLTRRLSHVSLPILRPVLEVENRYKAKLRSQLDSREILL
ncbi:hypothetical protein ACFX1R_014096 [Malus domestica]